MLSKSYVKHVALPEAPWLIPDLCKAYAWPENIPGGGVIGIFEAGGGWNQADVDVAFKAMGLLSPSIVDVSVDGTQPQTGSSADVEVALDIQVAAAAYSMATGKAASIRMYWSEDFAKAVDQAAADGCAVLSISWGAPENEWPKADVDAMVTACEAASAKGMIVLAAAGDNDADDGEKAPVVDFPASCPWVTACGGTMKPQIGPESVWNNEPGHANGSGTGGGYSGIFGHQSWQIGALAGRGRMVPDVAANADPNTGYTIQVNDATDVVGGTSAVAPLYAGLLAATDQKGPFGPTAFKNPDWFNDISQGNNGTYKASIGPDPCTGMGTPIGTKFVTQRN